MVHYLVPQRISYFTSNVLCLWSNFQKLKSKAIRLSLIFFLFSFYISTTQAQTYNGTQSFIVSSTTYTFDYTLEYSNPTATMTITFVSPPGIPSGLNPQLRLGPAGGPHTFVGMSGSSPTYSVTLSGVNCCPTPPITFWLAYAGGLYQSPVPLTFPLPIALTDFSTKILGTSNALLSWKTSSEINSDYFGIERSTDGLLWDQIGKKRAEGNSNSEVRYDYEDKDIPHLRTSDKVLYYRLKLTDLDGSYKYSDIRGINFSQDISIISVYPNPAKDRINIDLSTIDTETEEVRVEIYNNIGGKIMIKKISGSGIELIDLNELPSGTYHIIVKQGLETIHNSCISKVY